MQIDKIFSSKEIQRAEFNKITNIPKQPPLSKDSYDDELQVSKYSQDYIDAMRIIQECQDVDYNKVAQAKARQNTQESNETLLHVARVILVPLMRL